ncbi:phage protease [Pseudogemmobacter bohemicus]|uniref:phage protease n=1 Tax=Pseudogemmobacter bohemicus TaxID=2250708 RepID=UPI000DD3F30A|nr:phage protease [Pseudogemmobacter bohemicus]
MRFRQLALVPEWVHLSPSGPVAGRDGRSFDLPDPSGLILAFQASGIDLPVDYQHQNGKAEARLNGPVPAAGRIRELRADESGIRERVEWTATAYEMIGRKEHRTLSPSFLFHPKTRQIVRLKGAGLVQSPNLCLTGAGQRGKTA